MVSFKSFKKGTLTILDSGSDDEDDGTTVGVKKSLSEYYARGSCERAALHLPSWSRMSVEELTSFEQPNRCGTDPNTLLLQSSHHEWSNSLPQLELLHTRIQNRSVQWSSNFRSFGDASFILCYYEWLEDVMGRNKASLKKAKIYDAVYASLFVYDRLVPVIRAFCEFWCPTTNTLHTSQGEISISLWDLHKLGGLPIWGAVYDEVVPSIAELEGKTNAGTSVSIICHHLLFAYHKIMKNDPNKKRIVKLSAWVDYWYKGGIKYSKPSGRVSRKKTQAPVGTHKHPSGILEEISGPHPPQLLELFEDLGVNEIDVEKTYLAAFLVCWLCKFVFPESDESIRPGVFHNACNMAHGLEVSLAIPVLANIYFGLSELVRSPEPGVRAVSMPSHYLYAWLAEYFDTHFSKSGGASSPRMVLYEGFRSARPLDENQIQGLFALSSAIKFDKLAWYGDGRELIDQKGIESDYGDYFMCLRSGYLSHQGSQHLILQLYSPHRFGRQFGYHQHIPGHPKPFAEEINLNTLAKYLGIILRYSGSKIVMPSRGNLTHYSITKKYLTWWRKVFSFECPIKATKRVSIILPSIPRPCKTGLTELATKTSSREGSDIIRDRGSMESNTSDGVRLTRDSAGVVRIRSPMSEACDNSSDSDEVVGDYISRQAVALPNPRERDNSNSDDSECHPNRKRARYDDVFVEENLSQSLDPNTFFEGVDDSLQPIGLNELVNGPCLAGARYEGVETVIGDVIPRPLSVEDELTKIVISKTPSTFVSTREDIPFLDSMGLLNAPSISPLSASLLLPMQHHYPTPLPSSVCVDVGEILRQAQVQAASVIAGHVREILLNSSLENVPLVKEQLEALLVAMSQLGHDVSILRVKVEGYLKEVDGFISMHTAYSGKNTPEHQEHILSTAESSLASALTIEDVEVKLRESHQASLAVTASKRVILQKELDELDALADSLRVLLSESDARARHQAPIIVRLREQLDVAKKTPVLTHDEVKTLKTLRERLEAQRSSFKDFNFM